jgi:uncharacterized protein YdaU (DUF1376 family)
VRSAPAIPFFGDAYLADTRHLSLEEHGAYLQLLMIAWRIEGCRLPDDDARLARMLGITGAKWRKLKPTVMAFWTLENGHWTQRRLSKERQFVEEKSAKNSASAKARWDSQATENKQGDGCERTSERNAPPPPPKVEEKGEAKASPQKKPDPRGFRLPDDWEPRPLTGQTAAMVAAWPPGMLERQLAQFRDHYRKTPGAKGRSLDWDASLRTWLRNADDWRSKNGQSATRGNVTGLRGSRPDPALDLLRQGDAQLAAEWSDQAPDRGAWTALPAVGTG